MTLFERLSCAATREGLDVLVIGGHAVNAYGFPHIQPWMSIFSWPCPVSPGGGRFSKWLGTGGLARHEAFARLIAGHQSAVASGRCDAGLPRHLQQAVCRAKDAGFWRHTAPVPKPLHLIALKLHAMRNPERFKKGKEYPGHPQPDFDLPNRPKTSRLEVLDRYASDETRNLLAAHLP